MLSDLNLNHSYFPNKNVSTINKQNVEAWK